MDFFEIIDRIKYYVGRYLPASIFLIVGLILLSFALTTENEVLNTGEVVPVRQNPMFVYSSFFFIGASIVWILFLSGVINTTMSFIIVGITAVSSVVLLYADYRSVQSTVDFRAAVELRDLNIKARMDDLKQAELAYRETNGTFTDNLDDLIDFVKNGKKMRITKSGGYPERKITPEERDYLYNDNRPIDLSMTEREAALLAVSPICPADLKGFIRDTNYVSVMDAVFRDSTRIVAREKIGASLAFHPDSLRYIPFTKRLVSIDTGSVMNDDTRIPTLLITIYHPMNKELKKDSLVYTIGDSKSSSLAESWKK